MRLRWEGAVFGGPGEKWHGPGRSETLPLARPTGGHVHNTVGAGRVKRAVSNATLISLKSTSKGMVIAASLGHDPV